MAKLGIRTMGELTGRADLLATRQGIEYWKAQGLDFSRIFTLPTAPASVPRLHTSEQDHELDQALDQQLIAKAASALEKGDCVSFSMQVKNIHRSVGADRKSTR